MSEFFKTKKIIIEYPARRRNPTISISKDDPETIEYCEMFDGDMCYFKKEADGIFRIYKRIKGEEIYSGSNEE